MMKNIKIFLLIALLILVSLVNGSFLATQIAQGSRPLIPPDLQPRALIPVDLPALPSPGLVPGDFFFFLDGWGEAIGEIFTFRPEDKARLQAERVLERTAEIKAILVRDGIDSPYLAMTERRIQHNMAKVARILEIEIQKVHGAVIAELAKELSDKFDARHALLEGVFETAMEDLEVQEKNLKDQIRRLRQIGDFERIEKFRTDLVGVRAQKERVSARKDDMRELLEIEKNRIGAKMVFGERSARGLVKEAKNLFDRKEMDKERVFEQKEKALELQEEVLEIQLEEAFLIENLALIEQIKTKLQDLEVQEKDLETEREIEEKALDQKKGRLGKAMAIRERAVEQIKEAREEIFNVKEEKAGLTVDLVEIPVAVLELISQAENKLVIAELAFAAIDYGKAFGQAMAAEMLAKNAGRMLEEKEEAVERLEELKEELVETKRAEEVLREAQRRFAQAPRDAREEAEKELEEARERYQERLKELEEKRKELEQIREIKPRTIPCQVDIDCINLICPMVIGKDTPQCGPRGMCICGPGDRICLMVLTPAINPITGVCRVFPDSCQVPAGWRVVMEGCPPLQDEIRRPDGDYFCAMVITPAINPVTGECRVFPDSCHVPAGWIVVMEGCPHDNRERRPDDGRRMGIICRTDRDCAGMICPTAIGIDTPQCGPRGMCICGPGERLHIIPDDEERRLDNGRIFCAQVLTPAINPVTGECRLFPDTCSVAEGWIRVRECPPVQDEIRILPIPIR